MKYDLDVLADYVSKGLIVGQSHHTLPLAIFNYSRECQYEGLWDEITLNMRGTILDNEGNVVAKTFPKFFNYEEHIAEDSKLPSIPNENFEVYEKLDGSLGIIFHYGGEWHIASKGSFTSEQAIKGKELLDKMNTEYGLYEDYTYLVEIIYPENRIVVDYGNTEKLVVLGCYNRITGEEGEIDNMTSEGWEVVKMYKTWGEDWETLKKEISKDNEGYVIRFKSGFRMKIKGEEYLRLHRILTNISTRVIWRMLMNNEPLEPILERVPDEFDVWFKEVVKDLQTRFDNIYNDYFNIFLEISAKVSSNDRKAFAEEALKYPHPSILFSFYDGKHDTRNEYIWKLLKPKYEKAFKTEE